MLVVRPARQSRLKANREIYGEEKAPCKRVNLGGGGREDLWLLAVEHDTNTDTRVATGHPLDEIHASPGIVREKASV